MPQKMVSLAPLFKAYAELESDIRELQSGMFSDVCGLCTSCCCTPNICEESQDSAFLRQIQKTHAAGAMFCDRFGWLTEKGCALSVGRPPICYEFFCDDIIESIPEFERDWIRGLGRLIPWVGRRAVGPRHLVEVMEDEDLILHLKVDRVMGRIAVARKAFSGAKKALRGMAASDDEQDAMREISGSGQFDS